MVKSGKITARVEDPDLLTDDTSTAEAMLMFFDEKKDKFRNFSSGIQIVWMKKDGTITGHPDIMGLVLFDRFPGGCATIEQAFNGITKVEKTERFVGRRSIPKDKRRKPVYTLHRLYKVYFKEV